MILVDLSSCFYKSLHGLVSRIKKTEKTEFVDILQYRDQLFSTMLNIIGENVDKFSQFYRSPRDIVICLDDKSTRGNWRKNIYPMYKQQRKSIRQQTGHFKFDDAYSLLFEFISILQQSQFFTVVGVETCEADDIIMVLAKHFAKCTPVMILSPDKDFIQLQQTPNISQYSWMTNKLIKISPQDMQDWLLEHVCIGDVADNVPKITSFIEFNPGVVEYLEDMGIQDPDPYAFSCGYYNPEEFDSFGGVYKDIKFGVATLRTEIRRYGSLEKFLDSNPTYRKNYYRNRQLVLEEGIPNNLREKIIQEFENPATKIPTKPCSVLVELLGFCQNLPGIISNKYITEKQLGEFLLDF